MDNKYKKLKLPDDTAWERADKNYYVRFKRFMWKKAEDTIFEDVVDKTFDFIRNLQEGMTNYKNWYKIIWKDRNWDQSYIYTILEHKLFLQRNELVGSNRNMSTDEYNRDITIALNLIDKLKDGFYSGEYSDYDDTEIVFTPIEGKDASTVDIITKSENYDEYLSKYKATVRKLSVIHKNNSSILSNKKTLVMYVAQYNEDKARKLLFKLLHDKIERWWD